LKKINDIEVYLKTSEEKLNRKEYENALKSLDYVIELMPGSIVTRHKRLKVNIILKKI